MPDEHAVSRLAQSIQAAALEPTGWEQALNAVNAFVGGDGAALLSVQTRRRITPTSTDMGEMMTDYFEKGWYANDAREACLPLLRAKGIVFDHQFQSPDEIESGDYYHDFLARHRRKWFAGVGASTDGDEWCLALQRYRDRDPFSARDLTRLKIVRGLLSNAAILSASLGRSWIRGLQEALHAMPQPAALVDSRARILDVNDLAMSIIGTSIGKDGLIGLASREARAALEGAVKKALLHVGTGPEDASCVIQIGNATFACRAVTLFHKAHLIATNAAALIVIKPVPVGMSRVLRDRFGLTDAEIRVASSISKGSSVRQIAEDYRVKTDTVRTQLKSIFQKVNVSSQSQLVAFLRDLSLERGLPATT